MPGRGRLGQPGVSHVGRGVVAGLCRPGGFDTLVREEVLVVETEAGVLK